MQTAAADSKSLPLVVASENQAVDSWAPWVFHFGPLSIGSDGVDLKPQLKLGGQYGNFVAETGFSDVRDGLKFDMGCRAFVDAEGSGNSIAEVHDTVKLSMKNNVASASSQVSTLAEKLGCERTCVNLDVLGDALDVARRVLSNSAPDASSKLDQIAKTMGVDLADLQNILEGRGAEPGSKPIKLNVRASTGMGVSGQMCLGWCDLEGYHMIGVGATATTMVAMGLKIFAGKHSSGVGVRIVLGIGNFTLEYTFPQAVPRSRHGAATNDVPAQLAVCES